MAWLRSGSCRISGGTEWRVRGRRGGPLVGARALLESSMLVEVLAVVEAFLEAVRRPTTRLLACLGGGWFVEGGSVGLVGPVLASARSDSIVVKGAVVHSCRRNISRLCMWLSNWDQVQSVRREDCFLLKIS